MAPSLRPDGLFDRPFLYHLWDDPAFDGKPEFSSASIKTKKLNGPGTSLVKFYSLKRDLEALRAIGAKKLITARSGATPQPIVDAGENVIGKGSEFDPTGALRELNAIKIGVGSDHKVLVTGCHHAREWLAVQVPYLTAEYLINNFTDTPTTPKQKRIKHLLANRQIWIIPLCNPDGHDRCVRQDRNWRTNRNVIPITTTLTIPDVHALYDSIPPRTIVVPPGSYTGVDINRNYPTSAASTVPWGLETYSTKDPARQNDNHRMTSRDPRDGGDNGLRQVFAGLSPGDQPETKAIVDLMDKEKFHGSITYHSYSADLLYPDDAETPGGSLPASPFAVDVVRGMSSVVSTSGTGVPYPAMKGSDLYPDTGDLLDFAYDRLRSDGKSRPSCLPEVRPAGNPPPGEDYFSGVPAAQIYDTWKENLGALLAFINCCGFEAKAGPATVKLPAGQSLAQVVGNGWRSFEGWKP
jgi:hypothetical protein